MIIDGVLAAETSENPDFSERALVSFLRFIEKRLDVLVVRNTGIAPPRTPLSKALLLGKKLQEQGVIKSFNRASEYYQDEPPTKSWYAICNDATSHAVGGTTWENDSDALYAALAEGLERYIWFTQDDYFPNPTRATADEIQKNASCVRPEEFAGFSQEQRSGRPDRELRSDADYLWISGTSLVTGEQIFIPTQTVSRARPLYTLRGDKEPVIRQTTTNGLATWPTQSGARLAGALELIEREAYMTMWLNQLTLPRISLASMCARYPELVRCIETCEQYRLKVHVIQLLTDAPTHAVAVVLEDASTHAPRFTVGLRAHRSLPTAVQKATTEALRARRGCRAWLDAGNVWDMSTPVEAVGHRERLYYWSVPDNAKKLEFLIEGAEIPLKESAWDRDTESEHLQRVLRWCAEKKLECVSVSLGTSAKNPTPWHIEMVVMPQLLPTYLEESLRAFGGTRWRDIPEAFGYTPLAKPFAQSPHPFS